MSEGASRADIFKRLSQNRLGGEQVPADLKALLPLRDELHKRSGFRIEWETTDWAPWRANGCLDVQGPRGEGAGAAADANVDADTSARLQAVEQVCQHIAFVAADDRGRSLGYWRGPTSRRLTNAPLVLFEPPDLFRVCFASTFAEALLEQAYGGEQFKKLRAWFRSIGISIGWEDPGQLTVPYVKPSPKAIYKALFNRLRAGGPSPE